MARSRDSPLANCRLRLMHSRAVGIYIIYGSLQITAKHLGLVGTVRPDDAPIVVTREFEYEPTGRAAWQNDRLR